MAHRPARAVVNAREAVLDIGLDRAERQGLAPRRPAEERPAAPSAGVSRVLGARPALQTLSRAECLRLLGTRKVGRFAFIAREGLPLILPVNYALDGESILIRSGVGPKLQAAERGELVSFEVDDLDETARGGWSVVVTGTAERLRWSHHGSRALVPVHANIPEPWADGRRPHLIRIHAQRITGRRLPAFA